MWFWYEGVIIGCISYLVIEVIKQYFFTEG